MILREDAREYLVAIACEPEAAPDAAEIEAWHRRMVDQYERFGFTRKTYHALVLEGIALMRRAQPATANELAIRELEAAIDLCRKLYAAPGGHIADALCERLAALRQPAPAKEENQ